MNLFAANQRQREAMATLKSTQDNLISAVDVMQKTRRAKEGATAAALAASVADAVRLSAAQRDATDIDAAAERAVHEARANLKAAESELHEAREGARQAAYAIIVTEAEGLADQIERAEANLEAMRARLNAVRDLPHFPLNSKIARAVRDDINTPIPDLRLHGDLDVPLNRIGLVPNSDAARQEWEQRVADLLSDGDSTASDAAAA